MVKIKSESEIDINELDYKISELPNELLSKSLICRQNIIHEFHNNKDNFNGIKIIYKDYIKKLINNEIIDFELPDIIKLNIPNDKISQLESEVIKEFEKALKTKFKIMNKNTHTKKAWTNLSGQGDATDAPYPYKKSHQTK